jgi:Terminase large subunit, T4likevirus-type, N-terminal
MSTVGNILGNLDAAAFAEEKLGFIPDSQQRRVLMPVKRGILNCCRQWGKSTLTSVKAVHHALSKDGSLTIVVSPSERQSAEFVRKAAQFVSMLDIRPRGDGKNSVSLLLPNGSRIVGLPGRESTIRGFSAVSLLLIDEASRVPDDLYKAVRPMLAVGGGSLWLMSTPFGKRGFFYETWTRPGSDWLRIHASGPECPRIPKEFLDEERQVLGDASFRQEYLCEFVSTEGLLFDVDAVRARISDDVEPLFPGGALWR